MAGPRSRDPRWILSAVVVALVALGLLAARYLEFAVDRVTTGGIVVGLVLVVGALAVPALLLAGWQEDDDSR